MNFVRRLFHSLASLLGQHGRKGSFFPARQRSSGLVHSVIFVSILLFQCFNGSAQSSGPGWPQVRDRLEGLLAGNAEQKRTALAEIRNLRTVEASRLATAALTDKDAIVRATAAASVVFLPQLEAADALLNLLSDKDPFVRREAAYALGRVGHPNANAGLLRLMTADRDLEVRAAAAVAVGNIGDPSSIESLLRVLDKRPKEEEEFLRRSVARAIGQIFEGSVKGSTETLTPQNFLPPEFKDVENVNSRIWTIDDGQLVKISSMLEKIIRSRDEADDTRREAAFALGSMRRPESAGLLTTLLASPDPYLAEISREALLKIESEKRRRRSDN